MRALVTGGRRFDPDVACAGIVGYLRQLPLAPGDRLTLIHGACMCARMADNIVLNSPDTQATYNDVVRTTTKGADLGAEWAAAILGANRWAMPAEWDYHGRGAGPIRNGDMLDEWRPDVVLAFPSRESVGTRHMIREAIRRGIPVEVWEPDR